MSRKKVTVPQLQRMKQEGRKITMLTCYDATFMRILDEAGVDIVLVGDSLGMVIQGNTGTTPVTMEEMIYHGRIVSRGVTNAHLLVDMPFMSYQASVEDAVRNAGRLVKEGGAESVKLEGGRERAGAVRAIDQAGIPVMAHIGLTPQSLNKFGGFKVQGKGQEQAMRLIEDAKILEEAGAYAVLMECVPAPLAAEITQALSVPTIGIGAGAATDGQVLVIYDLLGMDNSFNPKFARRYANLNETIKTAVGAYIDDVRGGAFPGEENSY
ncbi:MAG: 3-methyl-2-oxobutanoate hydroxymethyltransferase [Myxococcota bacterium]